jgi:hypothetical protein
MMKRLATLTAVFIAVTAVANSARGDPPDVTNFECSGPFIKVVGHDGVVGDPIGEYCVTARDFNNVPIPNAPITVDFSNCDIQLCADQKDPGVTVDCTAQTVRRLTDVNGVACFRVIGRRRSVDCAVKPTPCVEVFFEGTFVCALFAPVFDLVDEPGVGVTGNDLSEFLHLFLECGVYLTAIDYNGNRLTDGDDFSQFLKAFFAGGSALGCDSKCP